MDGVKLSFGAPVAPTVNHGGVAVESPPAGTPPKPGVVLGYRSATGTSIPGSAISFSAKPITLEPEDFCRHTLILGSSGSGKTTRAFNPILLSALTQFEAGGLVIAAKPEAVTEAVEICERAGREYVVVQPGDDTGINVFTGSPELDAMYLRDLFGRCGPEMKPWIDAAVSRLKNAFIILSAAGHQYYRFDNLANYVFDDKYANDLRIYALERLRHLDQDSQEAWSILEAVNYEDKRYRPLSESTRASILFAVAQILEPLRDYHIIHTFARPIHLIPMERVFDGLIVILHVPRIRYELAAQAIYTLAKRRFFTAVENRRVNEDCDQDRLVVFAADEYQMCISDSDVQSLGIVRSAGCAVLAATQGISSLHAVLSRDVVASAIQNFTQKILFKTDDIPTLHLFDQVLSFRHDTDRPMSSRAVFEMSQNQALCHLTAKDDTFDEVVNMKPLFIDRRRGGRGESPTDTRMSIF